MKLARHPSHVIFDLDGILLDSEALYTQATQEILAEYSQSFDWSLKANMIGRDSWDSARYLLTQLEIPLSVEQYMVRWTARLHELLPNVQPVAGARELVARLRSRAIAMAVATSSDRARYELETRHHDWFALFQGVVCGDDPGIVAAKPAPDLFLAAAAQLGASAADCLVFEDAPAGVQAARAAGMQVVLLPDPRLEPTRFAGPDLVIRGYDQLRLADLGW